MSPPHSTTSDARPGSVSPSARGATIDALQDAEAHIRNAAEARQVFVIDGHVDTEEQPGVVVTIETPEYPEINADAMAGDDDARSWASAVAAGAEAFIRALERLEVRLVVLRREPLSRDDWDDAVNTYESAIAELAEREVAELGPMADDTDAGGRRTEVANALAALRVLRDQARRQEVHIGAVATLSAWALTRDPAVTLSWRADAPWSHPLVGSEYRIARYRDALDQAIARDRAWEEPDSAAVVEQRELRVWSGKKRKDLVRRTAEHPDFPRCKTEAERVHLLEMVAGDEAPTYAYLLKELAREAAAVYKLEVVAR